MLQQITAFFLDYLSLIITILNSLVGISIFLRVMKKTRQELKTAPKYTLWQRGSNVVSGIAYALMVACTITFVFALISSMVAENILFYINNFRRDLAYYDQWVVALKFPTFLPSIILVMGAFAVWYSLVEYILMAQPSQDAPMEIQRWIEKNFIDRFRVPFSYFTAILLFFLIVILPPFLFSRLSLQYWSGLTPNAKFWLQFLVFMVWFMLGPIMYLSYYSQIGIAQAFFRGRKIDRKKDKKSAFFYYIAILGIITTVYTFFKVLFLIFDERPDVALNPIQAQGEFWPVILEFIRNRSNWLDQDQIETILGFFAIFPFSFGLFILTTCIFGLLGFYAKFLSKEPLNTPKMVLFAAYIITGIAFSIFINAVVYFPYGFPTQFLNRIGFPLNTKRIEDQILLLRIFAVPLLIEKVINLTFLLNFLFVNKSVKDQVEKSILNQALVTEDLDIFQKYLTHKDPKIKIKLIDYLLDYIRLQPTMTPKIKNQLSEIFSILLLDEDPEIQQRMSQNLNQILQNINISGKQDIIIKLIGKESNDSFRMSFLILDAISEQGLDRDVSDTIFKIVSLILQKSSKKGLESHLVEFLNKMKRLDPAGTKNYIYSLAQSTNRMQKIFAINFIAKFPTYMHDLTLHLIPIFQKNMKNLDVELTTVCLQAFTRLATHDLELIPKVMAQFNSITLKEYSIIREKIGAIVQFNLIKPEWFVDFFKYLEIFLKDTNTQILVDATVALGTMTTPITQYQFFDHIYPYLKDLVSHKSLQVKKAVISSLIIIAQTRKDIYKNPQFQKLFSVLILDNHPDVRHQIYRFFIQGDPQYLLIDIISILKQKVALEIQIDLLNVLSQIAGDIIPYIDEYDVYSLLISQPVEEKQNVLALDRINELQEDKSTIFGFNAFNQSISLYDAVISLLYEITYYVPEKYPNLEEFAQKHQKFENDLSFAKKVEFYSKIIYDELGLIRTHGINFPLTSYLQLIQTDFDKINRFTAEILIKYLPEFNKLKPELHNDIFNIYISLIQKNIPLSSITSAHLLYSMVEILVNNQEEYFQKKMVIIYPKNKVVQKNPFEAYIKPFIIFCMKLENEEVQKSILRTMQLMVENFKIEHFVRDFLLNAVQKSRNPTIKVSAMIAFTALPIKIEEKKNIQVLLKQVRSKDNTVKSQAIESLGIIIRAFPTIGINEKSKNAHLVNSILYKAFYDPYSVNADISVRQTIVNQLKTIILIQPNLQISLKILQQLSNEPDEGLATQSLETFFDYINFNQKSISEELIVLHRYSNSSHFSVQKLIAEKISELWSQKIQIEGFIPIIINLSTSHYPDIRTIVFQAIFDIFQQNPKLIPVFYQNLFDLTQDNAEEVRKDALEIIYRIVNLLPVKKEQIEKINHISQKLANDPSTQIQMIIATNLPFFIQNHNDFYPAYMHILFNFLRKHSPELLKQTITGCRVLIEMNPDSIKDFIKRIKKIFKKTQNPLLETFLIELQLKIKEK